MNSRKSIGQLVGAVVLLLSCLGPSREALQPPISRGSQPVEACQEPPEDLRHLRKPRELTNNELIDSTWRAFVALNWSADLSKERGQSAGSPGFCEQGTPRVWETWKSEWETDGELFEWKSHEIKQPPCQAIQTKEGQREPVTPENWPALYKKYGGLLLDHLNLITTSSRPSDLSFQYTGPLIDRNRQYMRYGSFFNKDIYECFRSGDGKNCQNNEAALVLPYGEEDDVNSIAVKAAWRVPADEQEKDSHVSRDVLVTEYEGQTEPFTKICRQQTMILVGLHIVQKSNLIMAQLGQANKNGWIWASFEHKDNAKTCTPEMSFAARGYSEEPAVLNPYKPLPPLDQRTPVELCRLLDRSAPPSLLSSIGEQYQKQLPLPWRNYKMVGFQWFFSGQSSPSNNVANVMLEPYSQQNSCMGCHDEKTSVDGDFMWSLALKRLKIDEVQLQLEAMHR